MAVAVAVAVSGGVAVPVAGLTKRFFDQIFLNQCLGLFCLEDIFITLLCQRHVYYLQDI